jgi:hypothetical protein
MEADALSQLAGVEAPSRALQELLALRHDTGKCITQYQLWQLLLAP